MITKQTSALLLKSWVRKNNAPKGALTSNRTAKCKGECPGVTMIFVLPDGYAGTGTSHNLLDTQR